MAVVERYVFADYGEAIEEYFERGFTDGMPVVPPTPEAVEAMLAAAGLNGDEVLGAVPTRDVVVTADKVAVNAVMAGCKPDYFPVVVAAVRAQLQPIANAHGTTSGVSAASHAVILNGPVRKEVDVNCAGGCFGPGFRANATIGRAVRLVIRNVEQSVPGGMDRATFSSAWRYSFCFGENEEASDWEPFHVQRGFAREDSVATVYSVTFCLPALEFDPDPTVMFTTMARTARQYGMGFDEELGSDHGIVIVVGMQHQRQLIDAGLSKRDCQEALWPLLTAPETGRFDKAVSLAGPEKVLLVAAGGPGLPGSWVLLPGGSNPVSELVVGS